MKGWVLVGPKEREAVDRVFQTPMIILALLVLPILAIENFAEDLLNRHAALQWAVMGAMGVIWLAFVVEFVVKISIAESRVRYVAKNWLDLVIILLPFLRLLRGVQALRTLRMARVLKVFTLRGVAMKLFRTLIAAALGWGLIKRMLKKDREDPSWEEEERRRLDMLSRDQLVCEIITLKKEAMERDKKLVEAAEYIHHLERRPAERPLKEDTTPSPQEKPETSDERIPRPVPPTPRPETPPPSPLSPELFEPEH